MTAEQFKSKNSLEAVLAQAGVELKGQGRERVAKCPFHADGSPSFNANLDKGVWICRAGCGGGDVIEFLAKVKGMSSSEFLRHECRDDAPPFTIQPLPKRFDASDEAPPAAKPVIDVIYPYLNEFGKEVFQVLRLKPKTFRQRHTGPDGKWVWTMEGVRRVLFHLPEVLAAEQVWICEGEKDCENLKALGYCATTNVGGAGKWLDSYTEYLEGKEIVLCGDNDEPGRKHVDLVFASISKAAKNTRKVKLPELCKDVSDYIASFKTPDEAKLALDALVSTAPLIVKGHFLPVRSFHSLEQDYQEHIRNLGSNSFSLGAWLPFLGNIRPLVPGELCLIIASTGTGKTAVLQNIALHTAPLPTILFEMELPAELMYERFICAANRWTAQNVELSFKAAVEQRQKLGEIPKLSHVYVCTESRLDPASLEAYINRSELVIGQRPKVVLVDYVQLMKGKGKTRYERASDVAEELKIIAKSTRTIIIVSSQMSRPGDDEKPEVSLHDAKETGSLENSAGLVFGLWRDAKEPRMLHLKVLKSTKGGAGIHVQCCFNAERMHIEQWDK